MNDRRGCIGGLVELLFLKTLFDWLESRFGFGQGCSCTGVGCGFIILTLFLCAFCSIFFNVDWTSFRF